MDVPEQMGIPPEQFRVVIGRTQVQFDANKDAINRGKG